MLYSFDIFETLVTRRTASEIGIWLLVRESAQAHCSANVSPAFLDDFPYIRSDAQRRANQLKPRGEITLDEIYAVIADRFPDLAQSTIETFKSLEVQTEIEYSFGIADNITKLLELLDQGQRVVLISDMFLSGDTIRAILDKAEPRLSELPLYLSSAVGVRKADGDLFKYVLEQEGVSAADVEHFGDNPETDIRQAVKIGIKPVLYPDAHLNTHERLCLFETYNLSLQLFVGASRQARLQQAACGREYRLGSGFTGPLFYGFVLQAIESAISRGERRIYFLARDGYLLKTIAEAIIEVRGYNIEVAYIYVSRKSLYPACFFSLHDREFWWIFEEMSNRRTLGLALERLQLTPAECAQFFNAEALAAIGIPDLRKRLTGREVNRVIAYIQETPELRESVLANSRTSRERLTAYLRSEGLLDGETITLIDIGWRGTAQDAIFRVLREAKPAIRITEHYLGVSYFSHLSGKNNQKLAYVRYVSNKPSAAPVFEHLLQADHGRTIAYREVSGKRVEPVLEPVAVEQKTWDFSAYRRGVATFARILTAACDQRICTGHFKAITSLLIESVELGDKEIAEALGDLTYGFDQEESGRRKMAPAIDPWTALKFLCTRPSKREQYTLWLEGSFLRSGTLSKIILRLEPGSLLKRLFHAFIPSHELKALKLSLCGRLKTWKKRRLG